MARRRVALVDAHRRLDGIDPVLDRLMAEHGSATLPAPAPSASRFHSLAESIAYQQLNGTAAATIWRRVTEAAGERVVTPWRLMALGEQRLRACGLSGAKTRSMLDLSVRIVDGDLRLDRIGRLSDDEVVESLCTVWGIGPWTAQMFLMFNLGRLDVWPVGDYGVRSGYAKAWGLDENPTEREMPGLGERFSGARSVVAWYCWRVADDVTAGRTAR